MAFGDQLLQLVDLGTAYAGDNVRAYIKTNLGPPIPIYTGASGDGGGLLDLLGIKAGLIVTDGQGRTLATYGEPAETDPVRAAVLLLALGVSVFVLSRGILP